MSSLRTIQNRFKCRISSCTSSFRRKEHQNRRCPLCARRFSRSDSLRLHIRLDHGPQEPFGGGAPCSRCSAQARHCVYDDRQRTQQHDQQPQSSRTSQPPEDQTPSFSPLPTDGGHDSTTPREVAISLHRKLGPSILAQQERWTCALPSQGEPLNDVVNNPIPEQATVSRCPVATNQAILLYLIFSLVLNSNGNTDTNISNNITGICATPRSLDLTHTLSPMDQHILSLLVSTCLRNNIFYYPQMMNRYHHTMQSITCIWVGMEELKRFGLALYKDCRLCQSGNDILESEADTGEGRKVLRISDLQFPPPDIRHLWVAQSIWELSHLLQMEACRRGMRLDGRVEGNWISSCGRLLDGEGMER
ncbi:uncharacterized protein BO80DRAFT_475309 [Aspergillus ibericus CBS 121593]|uniref:C2H2-type domain-containing protein n=1 Tax=Aspergillus ibericus CBS 121593 TaxID=1448316 RepID=A0A395H0E1_9EURO|nr:hypothetical protein BO80DRAFT_475309 [Aspergillus ibericus CBS 121593]RAL00775.1 hypothetical protein BO80DRAFT_475309 [Aspergillus ibericus CBS 121593]